MKKFIICLITIISIGVSVLVILKVNAKSEENSFEISEKVENKTEENHILNDPSEDEIIEDRDTEIIEDINENTEVLSSKNDDQENKTKNISTNKVVSNVHQTETKKNDTSQSKKELVVTTTKPPKKEEPNPKEESSKVPVQQEPQKPKCTETSHGIGVGNSNKWFSTKAEAIAHYDNLIAIWGKKWENFEIDNDTYYKNCPSGYEVFSCPYCNKWTINLYY